MKKAVALFLCGCFWLSMCSCNFKKEAKTELTAMNTLMSIRVFSSSKANNQESLQLLVDRINELDALFDANNENSDVAIINGKNTEIKISEDTAKIIEKSILANTLTDGAFDITIMPVLKLWGFDNGNYGVPKKEEIKRTLSLVGYDKLFLEDDTLTKEENTLISLGGIAKGYLGDELLEIAKEYGVSAVISLGGNIVLCGENAEKGEWTVGVKNPLKTDELVCAFKHKGNVSVVTSGGYERSFKKDGKIYHHIIDTKTGEPAKSDLLSVTVIGEDGALCDAFSTALFSMGKEKAVKFAKEHNDFEYIFITENKEIIATDGVSSLELSDKTFIIK
ncbi:MAG: FAD:protein FMN transferase [Ruminococcaceae bacterium]|nr:FAD:protein FMN transferase [Oscillospiraceae bacterium]